VNDDPIRGSGDLSSRIGLASPGDKVTLKVWRNKTMRDVQVKLGNAESGSGLKTSGDLDLKRGQLGLTLRPLTRQELLQLQLKGGLLVEAVSGAAEREGLLPGDFLFSINGIELHSVDQVTDIIKKKPKSVALLVQRGNERSFISIELE
jgi:serine protease Do